MKNILIISASDSIAGAGMQADLKACTLIGVYATSCLTAITAQNTGEVREVYPLPPALVASQIDCILDDLKPDALKIGLLGSIDVVNAVATAIEKYNLKNVVLDPVLVATCGDGLLAAKDAERFPTYMAERLFRLATVITPNLREASALSGIDAAENPSVAFSILNERYGARSVLIKGGDSEGDMSIDLLYSSETGVSRFAAERVMTRNTHGSGCTLSSAIAAFLALGNPLPMAIKKGKRFVTGQLEHGKDVVFGCHGYGSTVLF